MATQTTTFYTPQQQLHMDAFEWWSKKNHGFVVDYAYICLLYTSPSPRD